MSRTSITSEVVDQDEFPDDRFVSDEFTLPSLQKMAAYRVALPIWYNLISSEKRNASIQKNETISYYRLIVFVFTPEANRKDYFLESYYKKFDELVTISFSTTPRFVREILTECLREIHTNVYWWIIWSVNYVNGDFTRYRMDDDVDPNCCVWYPNGKIDYRKSVENILNRPGLNAEQKFTLMAKYCMENEIKTFSLHSLDPDFIKLVNFNNDCILYYWICYLKNALHEIPTDKFNSIDLTMAAKIAKNDIHYGIYWTAFQYFWNRLGMEDQLLVVKRTLNYACKDFERREYWCNESVDDFYDAEERLFSMLSSHQQRSFIYPTLDQSILIFCIRLCSPKITFWIWNLCKDLLTVEQFANMVDLILRQSVQFENVMKLFMHIWNTVPTHFRTYALKMKENEMISYFSCKRTLSPTSIKFLCEFLLLKSSDFRKQLMLRNAVRICIDIENPHCITELLNFCLPSQTDQMEFKKLVLNSDSFKEECCSSFVFGDENLFKVKSEYYALNVYDVINLKKWILESDFLKEDMFRFMFNVDKWNKISNLVDEIYPDDPSLALQTKKQIVLSFAVNPIQGLITPHADLEKFTTITEGLQFTDEEKENLKQICLNYLKETLYHGSALSWGYSCESLQKFTSWSVGDEEGAILNFKNTISLDIIFNNFFDGLLEIYNTDSYYFQMVLSQFNECLRWYFTSVQEMKKFKIDKINNCDIKILKILSERNDEAFLELLLKWFFDNDETAILEFKFKNLFLRESTKPDVDEANQ